MSGVWDGGFPFDGCLLTCSAKERCCCEWGGFIGGLSMVTGCIEKDRISTSGASFGLSVVWSCIGAHGYPIHIGGGGLWRNGALLGMFVVWSHMEGICRAHSQSNGVSWLDMETTL
ncbi:hypothetical protein F2Q69_00035689 [Brassica cretica]|uniref:Uncharacterized protein n=2 Tax=Brassica cretica TaxID=69181 RepID=A0A3N6SIX1_BRACR|nr:hypothetical protein DY000_02040257 [Brassica cretica]KAF3598799.1 hypothetical protein F2Q69_00035689 [Brassica cretica]